MKFNDLKEIVKSYNPNSLDKIEMAYNYAKRLHQGTFRESGEEYIIHPLNVAYILAEMHADTDTICAGLLHDTLEDTNLIKEDIEEFFGISVANLVDGVTKLSKMNFSSKKEQNFANTRKIITGIALDVRIIIIKLADRLHNMRTLEYKNNFKQRENALETLEIFVPLAYYIGAYRIKSELEDLSLKYLEPVIYSKIEEERVNIEDKYKNILNTMYLNIHNKLESENIHNKIKARTKNIYGIYKRLISGHTINDIHDLLSLKIMVNNVLDCYKSLGIIHSIYKPINDKFKDYICNPKTNLYSSLHTTVFGEEGKLVQTQIRTFEMDKIASFGLTAYWNMYGDNARNIMQEELKEKFQFYQSLEEIDKVFNDNEDFVNKVKQELFSKKIYVYSTNGEVIELPIGSTIIDFAYKVYGDKGNNIVEVIVNDKIVPLDTVLQSKDRVHIKVGENIISPNVELAEKARTTQAKENIKKLILE